MKKQRKKQLNEENLQYLRELLGNNVIKKFLRMVDKRQDTLARWLNNNPADKETYETVQRCLNQMEKFEDNHWWTSEDMKTLGYYQLLNPLLLVPFDKFHEAIEILLDRPVFTHEFGLNYDGLKSEAEKAFSGNQVSQEEKKKAIENSINCLVDSGKPVICVAFE